MTARPKGPLVGTLAVLVATLLLLPGCQFAGVAPSPSPAASPTASGTVKPVEPSPSATPPPTAEPSAVPVSRACAELIGAQTMYEFNPNFGLLLSFTPEPGSFGARAVNQHGVACRWLNQTSGAVIDVTVSQPTPSALEVARSTAQSGSPVHGLGVDTYFAITGGAGTAQTFAGPLWVTISSEYFASPDDLRELLASVLAAVS